MSDPKEKEVQAILQAIDYGHLPPRETQRRLLNIIQAEAARTDAPTDETKIHTCMDLLERLQGEQKPIAPARLELSPLNAACALPPVEANASVPSTRQRPDRSINRGQRSRKLAVAGASSPTRRRACRPTLRTS